MRNKIKQLLSPLFFLIIVTIMVIISCNKNYHYEYYYGKIDGKWAYIDLLEDTIYKIHIRYTSVYQNEVSFPVQITKEQYKKLKCGDLYLIDSAKVKED
jgi:hypothetical protein